MHPETPNPQSVPPAEEILLSVIVLVPTDWNSAAPTLRAIAAQSIAHCIQVVVVRLAAAPLLPDPAVVASVGRWTEVVPIRLSAQTREKPPELPNVAAAKAAGVHASVGPIVAMTENHAFVEPGWAEAVVRAHAESSAPAIGPALIIGNPGTLASWSEMIDAHGRWLNHPQGPLSDIPGHSSTYKRSALLELPGEPSDWWAHESHLHQYFRSKGATLHLAVDARVRHVNVSRWLSILRISFAACARYQSSKEHLQQTGLPRRLLHSVLLIARWPRCYMGQLRSAFAITDPQRPAIPLLALSLLPCSLASSIGLAVGCWMPRPWSFIDRWLYRAEYFREEFVHPWELPLVRPGDTPPRQQSVADAANGGVAHRTGSAS